MPCTLPPSNKGIVGLFTLCSITKVRAVGNRLSFPICTSTQRKSKCISEMVSACLKLDNKWTDLHACSMDEQPGTKITHSLLCSSSSMQVWRTITHQILIFSFWVFTCLKPQGQTKRPSPRDSTGHSGFKKSATKQIFRQATWKQAFSSYVFFLAVHVREREVRSISTGLGCLGKMIAFSHT